MAQAMQHGEIAVKCNNKECKKTGKVESRAYYAEGGLECKCGSKMSTIPAGKKKTHKCSRDRKPKGGQKG